MLLQGATSPARKNVRSGHVSIGSWNNGGTIIWEGLAGFYFSSTKSADLPENAYAFALDYAAKPFVEHGIIWAFSLRCLTI